MRIIELEIHCLRGITELKLKPQGKNMVIYGPNGSGKSAVVDAIDFLLTGKVSRLTGTGTSGISLSKHGPHVDYKPNDALVSAKVIFPDNDKQIVQISRCLANPGVLVCDHGDDPKISKKIKLVTELAERGQHVLTRREILRYITAEGATRAQQIQELMNVMSVEESRKILVRINHTLERDFNEANRTVANSQQNINRIAGISKFDPDFLLTFINKQRSILSGDVITELNPLLIKKNLSRESSSQRSKINTEIFEKDIKTTVNYLAPDQFEEAKTIDESLRKQLVEIRENPGLLRALDLLSITETGIKLIDQEGKCPLCDKEWPPGELALYLRRKLGSAELARTYKQHILEHSTRLASKLLSLKTVVQRIKDEYSKVSANLTSIEVWIKDIDKVVSSLSDPIASYPLTDYSSDIISRLLSPDTIVTDLEDKLKEVKEKFPQASPQQTAWDTLTLLDDHFRTLQQAKAKQVNAEMNYKKSDLLLNIFTKSKDQVLTELFEEISDEFVSLYKDLHGPDEDGFKAIMKPRGPALEFLVDFHGRGNHPPHALHSEGHQDSMGLCLYLCMGNKLLGDLFELLILDDVVMSVDINHRKELCRMIMKRFSDKQFIITTHDKTWATQLKSEGVVKSEQLIEFYDWRVETGPKVNQVTDIWEQIDESMTKNDIPSAAHRLRRGSELFLSEVCDSLQAPIKYKSSGSYELGELLPSAVSGLKKLLSEASQAAISWNDTETVEKIREYKSLIGQTVLRTNSEQWNINNEVHYNKWSNLTKNDFKAVVESFQDLFLLFQCSTCKGILYLTKNGLINANIRCNCGKTMWNLQLKKPAQ